MTDVTISTASTVMSGTSFGQSPVVGISANYAREDHSHGTPPNPVATRTYSDQTLNRTFGVVYTNTDSLRWMHITVQVVYVHSVGNPNVCPSVYILSDSNNPPTTIVAGNVNTQGPSTNLVVYGGGEISAYVPPGFKYMMNYNICSNNEAPTIQKWMELLF